MPARASEHLTFRWTGVLKSEGRREGNCSFLNSASALMRNECFREDEALSKPGFRMMDTPPPGFDEREEEFGDNTKNGLFQQVVNHPGSGRMDIVDNLKGRGFRFVTASRLAVLRGRNLLPGKTYTSFPPRDA